MKSLLITSLMLLVCSCEPVNLVGTFTTHKKVVLQSKNIWRGNKKVTVSPATFRNSKVRVGSSKLTIELNHSGKTTKIDIPTKNADLPSRSGSFTLSKRKIGQNYDISGYVDYSEQESSRRQVEHRPCTVVTDKIHKCNQRICGKAKCCLIEVEKPGYERHEYFNVNFKRSVKMSLVDNSGVAATFNGSGSGSFRRYVGSSFPECRLRY